MKVKLEKTFPMPASADTAWLLLQDIEAVASCMPGAKVTERVDDTHYKGTVALKLGPANMSFRGEIEVKQLDATARTLQLLAKGTDSAGGSGASMDLTARVDAVDGSHCNLVGISDVSVSGKAATFGARFMGPVTDQVLNQFAANFAARVQLLQADAPTLPAIPRRTPQPTTVSPSAAPQPTSTTRGDAPTPAAMPTAQPLNGLTLLWAALKGWLRSVFATKQP